jgi:hypothetical protein
MSRRTKPAPEFSDADEAALSDPKYANGKLQRLALRHLRAKRQKGEIPTDIRFVFYELEQQGKQSKRALNLDGTESKRTPTQNLNDAITHLRKKGLVPWEWIDNNSRDLTVWPYADSVWEALEGKVDLCSLDRFPGVPRPFLLCESRGVGGVLERGVAYEYLVAVAATGGQCAGYLHTKVVPYLRKQAKKVGNHVLVIGDADLSGGHIEGNGRRVIERALGIRFEDWDRPDGSPPPGANVWERLMLTAEQCRRLRARGVKPIRKKDKRYKGGRWHDAFETEALGQSMLTDIVRKRLEELAPEPLEDVQEREEQEQQEAKERLGGDDEEDDD